MSCIAFLFKMHPNRMKISLESIQDSIKKQEQKKKQSFDCFFGIRQLPILPCRRQHSTVGV